MKMHAYISKWLVHWIPDFFPKKKKAIIFTLEDIFQKCWTEVINILQLEKLTKPKLKVEFSPSHDAYHRRGVIVINSSLIDESDEQRHQTIDHEIAHYIQYSQNPNVQKTYSTDISSWFSWLLKGRENNALTKTAFREGFAEYVGSMTTGKLPRKTKDALKYIESVKRSKLFLQTKILPYALGYMAYFAIAQTKSEEYAIHLGLSADFSKWLSESRRALTKLGKPNML